MATSRVQRQAVGGWGRRAPSKPRHLPRLRADNSWGPARKAGRSPPGLGQHLSQGAAQPPGPMDPDVCTVTPGPRLLTQEQEPTPPPHHGASPGDTDGPSAKHPRVPHPLTSLLCVHCDGPLTAQSLIRELNLMRPRGALLTPPLQPVPHGKRLPALQMQLEPPRGGVHLPSSHRGSVLLTQNRHPRKPVPSRSRQAPVKRMASKTPSPIARLSAASSLGPAWAFSPSPGPPRPNLPRRPQVRRRPVGGKEAAATQHGALPRPGGRPGAPQATAPACGKAAHAHRGLADGHRAGGAARPAGVGDTWPEGPRPLPGTPHSPASRPLPKSRRTERGAPVTPPTGRDSGGGHLSSGKRRAGGTGGGASGRRPQHEGADAAIFLAGGSDRAAGQ
ncbi:translation initiation factor IF-2-like [Choloepus didactylus]|uniref:translation initiation factor IF-2-like n=1 Tax=Choloepus didactylus TaxID=27675 RepID=UPI00189F25E2|nr:translation initiation factor IF-2-like [Choloepus didactylus]